MRSAHSDQELPRRVLLIDDDANVRRVNEFSLQTAGFQVLTAQDGKQGLASFQADAPAVVITDIQMPGMSGYEVLQQVIAGSPDTAVIVITAYGSVDNAVKAMKQGAYDYLTKPFSRDELVMVVERAFDRLLLKKQNQQINNLLKQGDKGSDIIGTSEKMSQIFATVSQVAKSDASVLITGESGTGKERIARKIHQDSWRHDKPLVTINCAAIPANLLESELFGHVRGAFTGAVTDRAGKFAQADQGTLFLDEVGEMPMELQAKLLRVLQEKEIEPVGGTVRHVDVRIVAATNQDLEVAISEHRFREDLYYRLSVIPIELPPLRERIEDIPLLIEHFLGEFSSEGPVKLSDAAQKVCIAYSWPGNIRELKNLIQRTVILHPDVTIIDREHLPNKLLSGGVSSSQHVVELPPEGYSLEKLEEEAIRQALECNGWNIARTARFLDIPRHTLYYRIEKYGIKQI